MYILHMSVRGSGRFLKVPDGSRKVQGRYPPLTQFWNIQKIINCKFRIDNLKESLFHPAGYETNT